jgi:hypothetical protein
MKWTKSGEWIEGTLYRDNALHLELDGDEAALLPLMLPALGRELAGAERRYEHFYGLHEAGIATAGQQERMLYWEGRRDLYGNMIEDIRKFIGYNKKQKCHG